MTLLNRGSLPASICLMMAEAATQRLSENSGAASSRRNAIKATFFDLAVVRGPEGLCRAGLPRRGAGTLPEGAGPSEPVNSSMGSESWPRSQPGVEALASVPDVGWPLSE